VLSRCRGCRIRDRKVQDPDDLEVTSKPATRKCERIVLQRKTHRRTISSVGQLHRKGSSLQEQDAAESLVHCRQEVSDRLARLAAEEESFAFRRFGETAVDGPDNERNRVPSLEDEGNSAIETSTLLRGQLLGL